MATTPNDGGAAFPVSYGPDGTPGYADGMSLRDYFATAALQGMIAADIADVTLDVSASDAYRYADAMLAARQREGD